MTSFGQFSPRRFISRNTPAQESVDSRYPSSTASSAFSPSSHADDHEQAELVVLAQTDRHVHAVDEQVGVAAETQVSLAEAVVVGLPLLAQPTDRQG